MPVHRVPEQEGRPLRFRTAEYGIHAQEDDCGDREEGAHAGGVAVVERHCIKEQNAAQLAFGSTIGGRYNVVCTHVSDFERVDAVVDSYDRSDDVQPA